MPVVLPFPAIAITVAESSAIIPRDPLHVYTIHPVAAPVDGRVDPPPGEVDFVRGDANADRESNITDPVFILNTLFITGQEFLCEDAAGANDGGEIDISDALYLLRFRFLGGPAPPSPYPDCGPDPTDDLLTCNAFPHCGSDG